MSLEAWHMQDDIDFAAAPFDAGASLGASDRFAEDFERAMEALGVRSIWDELDVTPADWDHTHEDFS